MKPIDALRLISKIGTARFICPHRVGGEADHKTAPEHFFHDEMTECAKRIAQEAVTEHEKEPRQP